MARKVIKQESWEEEVRRQTRAVLEVWEKEKSVLHANIFVQTLVEIANGVDDPAKHARIRLKRYGYSF